MPDLPPDASESPELSAPELSDDTIPDSVISETFQPWIDRLKRNDRSFYNLMALEVWSLARTMDDLVPGFWSRFMEKRQAAIQQFVKHHNSPQQQRDDESG